MKKASGFAVVKLSEYKGENASPDKNGLMPLYMHPLLGEIPNRNVIAGSVAETQGLEEDGTYLVQWTKGDVDAQYGQRINWTNIKEVDTASFIELATGPLFNGEAGSIVDVNTGLPVVKATEETAKATKSRKAAQAG